MANKHYPYLEPFAKRLKALRGGRSRREVSAGIGAAEPRYLGWEQCHSSPNLNDLVAIAKFFGVSSDYLIGLDDAPRGSITANNSNVMSPNGQVNPAAPCRDCPHIATLNATIATLSQSIAALSGAK